MTSRRSERPNAGRLGRSTPGRGTRRQTSDVPKKRAFDAILDGLPPRYNRTLVEQAALGFAIATVARSQLAGIGAGIAFYFGETFATIFLPDIIKYMPFAVARASVDTEGGGGFGGGGGGGGGLSDALAPDTALLLVAAWLVGALLVSLVFTDRAEITG